MENINNSEINNQQTVNAAELNNELNGFNWGAFGFTWMWGLGNGSFNKTWHILLVHGLYIISNFIPFGSFLSLIAGPAYLALAIYYGLNGNKWAYENRAWWSLEDFTNTQKRWAIAVAVIASCIVAAVIIGIIIACIVTAVIFSSHGR